MNITEIWTLQTVPLYCCHTKVDVSADDVFSASVVVLGGGGLQPVLSLQSFSSLYLVGFSLSASFI